MAAPGSNKPDKGDILLVIRKLAQNFRRLVLMRISFYSLAGLDNLWLSMARLLQ